MGERRFEKLQTAHVVVVGYGAVGSFCAEALVRSGIGHIRLIDADNYEASNINRQLGADTTTIGRSKVDVGKTRLLAINPDLDIEICHVFIAENALVPVFAPFTDGNAPTWVVDAIDSLDAKVALLAACVQKQVRVYASMGAARKHDPTQIHVADLSKTTVCPLAREVRRRLKQIGIDKGIPCVFSTESAAKMTTTEDQKRGVLGSLIQVTGVFGLYLAAMVIDDVVDWTETNEPGDGAASVDDNTAP